MRCLDCQYDLKNLSTGGEHRCPECGRAFDPNNSLSFEREPHVPTVGERIVWIVYGCIVTSGMLISIAILIAAFLHFARFALTA